MEQNRTNQSAAKQSSFFSDPLLRTRILIIVLVMVVALLLITALSATSKPTQISSPSKPTQNAEQKPTYTGHTTLALTPSNLAVTSTGSLDVTIDTGSDAASAVQIELSYDPTAIGSVNIGLPQTGGFFENPIVLRKYINSTDGKISYILGIAPQDAPKTGKGTVATLTFTALRSLGQTRIDFSPKSVVTQPGVDPSILKGASGATITFSR